MKILQINTVYKEKSTGRTCFDVKRILEGLGHDAFVAYGKGYHNEANTFRIGTDAEYYFHNINSRLFGLQGYYSYRGTLRLLRYINEISPEIIHLRNLHANYLNLPLFFEFLRTADIPVVLHLHDCWAFTGKCPHYTDINCLKWKSGCFACPVKRNYPQSWLFDKSQKLYNDKKKWFGNIKNLTVIGVSEWTVEQAKMSFLGTRDIISIYNWVNRDVFHPKKKNVLADFGLNEKKFTVIGVSASWKSNSVRYKDFVRLSRLLADDMQILLVGNCKIKGFPKNVKHVPFVEDINKLADLFSSADTYVHLSTQDTFGKVIAEAMACGTPAIVYNSTALPELIGEGCGYVVESRDIHSVVRALERIKQNGKKFYSDKCVANVLENFDYNTNINHLVALYAEILDRY